MSLAKVTAEYYNERASVNDVCAGYTNPEAEILREPIKARFREIFKGKRVPDIACGTGYWTTVIGEAAEAVLGIDINCSLLIQARKRCRRQPNISFQIADAYKLKGVPGDFNAAFAHGWWSHIPKKNIKSFLTNLHRKLIPGTLVLNNDELPYGGFYREQDGEGNTLERRTIPDGRSFMIVKNFPDEQETRNTLSAFGDDIKYNARPEENHWEAVYRGRG